jgi:ATP-binding cassette, subfamily B, bacterial
MRTDEQVDRGVFVRGMRIIGSYIRIHPGPFLLSVLGAALYAGASIAGTAVLGAVTDRILIPAYHDGVSAKTAWIGAAAIMGVALVRAAGLMLRRYFSGMAAARTMATLRTRVADRYRELSLAFHREKPTGELLAHMEADVEAAVDVLQPVPFATGVILLVIFAIVSLLLTDPYLAAVGLLLIPSLALLNRSFARRMQGPAQRIQIKIGEVSAVAHESIDGALVVKTLGREDAETARFSDQAEDLRGERVVAGNIRAGFEPALEALPSLGIILLLAVGAWRVSTGAVTEGTLVQFVSLFYLLSWPLRFIGWILSDLPRAVVGRDRLEEVFREPVTVASSSSAVRLPTGPLSVEVQDIGYRYLDVPILERVSFTVAPGESVALVGATGSGKSTLAQLLVRLDDPDEGEVLLGGVNIRHADPGSLHEAATIVFQESFLFAESVRDNIALQTEVSDEGVRRAAEVARADGFIGALPNGLETIVGERGLTLSGGQRQRVALARALVRRPGLLILDDATSAVDPTIEAEILDGLRRELATTLIVVAYRLSTISLADRVLYLEHGRIAASGRHEDLLARIPEYAAMVRAYERGER